MGNNLGKKMSKEHSLGLMGNSMKGNGKMGNEVTGQNITNKDCILNQNIIFFTVSFFHNLLIELKMKKLLYVFLNY